MRILILFFLLSMLYIAPVFSQFNIGIGSSYSAMLLFPDRIDEELGTLNHSAYLGGVFIPELSIGAGFGGDFPAGFDVNFGWTGLNTFSDAVSNLQLDPNSGVDFKPLVKSPVSVSAAIYVTTPKAQGLIPKLKLGIGYSNVKFDKENDLYVSGPFAFLGIGLYLGYYGW